MNMVRPLVSVIVAVSEGERYISSALNSIFRQNYDPFEVIVVDGQSVDGTGVIARSFKGVKYICQAGQGLADGRNTGIVAAQGEFIAFLDADDLWMPDKLHEQIEHLMRNPEIHYVNAWVQFFTDPEYRRRSGYTRKFIEQVHIGRTPGTLVARKSAFDVVGLFSPDFSIACDAEWFVRAGACKLPMFIIPKVLLRKRIHNDNLSSNVSANRKELMAVIRQSIIRQRQHENGMLYAK